MKILEDRITKDGKVQNGGILRVDNFINHLMDTEFTDLLALEFYNLYKDSPVNKILTVEASGIGIAYATARLFRCPLLFAKKNLTSNITKNVFSAPVVSYTHDKTYNICVSKDYLSEKDCVLIIDDFLALGNALEGLISLSEQAGAKIAGAGIIIEKGFQGGGDSLRKKGYRIESLAIIDNMDEEHGIVFRK